MGCKRELLLNGFPQKTAEVASKLSTPHHLAVGVDAQQYEQQYCEAPQR